MRNGRQHDRLARFRKARTWIPYRVERGVLEEPIGPRGRLEIVNAWTDQLVKVVDEKIVPPVDSDDT